HALANAANAVVVESSRLDNLVANLPGSLLHHAAAQFPVQAAPVAFAHVALRPPDDELFRIDQRASDLHSAVARPTFAGQAHLECQLKIPVLLPTAQESVESEIVRPRGPLDHAVLHAPVLIESLPAVRVQEVLRA